MNSVAGKVVLITGAASGLGLADAMLLADEGATVVLTDINEQRVRAAAQQIGRGAVPFHQDVGEEAGWMRIIGEIEKRFGRLDVLVNNAGLVRYGSVEDCSLQDFQLQQRVMVEGVFLGCKHAIPLMAKSGGGSIINISSMGSHQGFPTITAYSAAKGAIRSMTKSIAIYCQQKGYGIRCNSIHPGKINTGLIQENVSPEQVAQREQSWDALPAGAYGAPKDVAHLVLYLASPASRFMTGSELVIDNGATMTPID
ncbi:SDR family oxidoreductase [Noviherbaspirillum sedimenti]|uniref:SDR family oxidoreductase n=1 Tax=Noviherbaspirillum sedimenti TaxID=2320865 RepID=A0A3A3G404_9BURK|nr:SDR family oxidoreductase [Noviherbaspirillum sedimenti]RJG03217.1 SDR family oxidoreductase [Noviherbaspirillum sedimenti]